MRVPGLMVRVLCFLLMVLAAGAASARMYVWQSPETGSLQASGTPPSWYRSERGGPRIQVFNDGKMLDDTAIALPTPHQEKLREEAFREFEERKESAALQLLEKAAKREAAKEAKRGKKPTDKTTLEPVVASDESSPSLPDQLDAETVDRLKAIISGFDKLSGGASN